MYEYEFYRRADGQVNLHFNCTESWGLCSSDNYIHTSSINVPMDEQDLWELSKAIHEYFETKP